MGGPQTTPRWETFPHGSDIGLRGAGSTLAQAFEQVALARTAVVTEPSRVRPTTSIPIVCQASDPELLLYDFVGALVFEMSTRRLLFARCSVRIADGRLAAQAFGEPVDVARHEPMVCVKG